MTDTSDEQDECWSYQEGADRYTHIVRDRNRGFICQLAQDPSGRAERRARMMAAAPDLLKAAELLEAAETAHVNCPDCDGEAIPETCGTCFPLFDDARLRRRAAIAKARGTP